MPEYKFSGDQQIWRVRTYRESLQRFLVLLGISVVFGISWQFISANTQWGFVADAPAQTFDLLSRMFPPNLPYIIRLLRPLWDTINIATLGTLIAIVVAVPAAFLAARNTTPHPVFRPFALAVIAFSRSVNSLIWALMLVMMIGPGILAGVLAIGLRGIGFVGKLLYEAIEEVNREAVEAVTATGASRMQIIFFAIVPQVLPTFAGITIFRWDANIRESTVVGLVGAGGIGLFLNSAIGQLLWRRASMILIVILLLVFLSEWISTKVRKAII